MDLGDYRSNVAQSNQFDLDVDKTPTFVTQPWNEQCKLDWRVNGELQEMKK